MSKRVSRSAIRKAIRAIARGWHPSRSGCGPGEFIRTKKKRRAE